MSRPFIQLIELGVGGVTCADRAPEAPTLYPDPAETEKKRNPGDKEEAQ